MSLKNIEKAFLFASILAFVGLGCSDTAWGQANTLVVSPTNLSFSTAAGTPQPQNLSVASSSGTLGYTISITSTPANIFAALSTAGTASTTPQLIPVYAQNYSSLASGTYSGTLTVTPASGAATSVTLTLTVGGTIGGGGSITATPNPVNLTSQVGVNAVPPALTLSNTGGAVAVNLSVTGTGNWLTVSPASTTLSTGISQSVQLITSTAALPAGSYQQFVNVTSTSTNAVLLTVPVNLTVSTSGGSSSLTATPNALTFNFNPGSTQSASQTLQITTPSATADNITVSFSGSFLSVNTPVVLPTSTTPATVLVTANPSGLTSNTSGSITFTSALYGTLIVPVTINFGTTTSTLSAAPNPINIAINAGSTTPVSQPVTVSTTSTTPVSITSSVTGLTWLSVTPLTSSVVSGTPTVFTVSANPQGIAAGTYSATLNVVGGGTTLAVPINVTVGAAQTISLNPPTLSFSYQTGTAFPQAQTLSLNTSAGNSLSYGVSAATQSGSGWLVVSPLSGATPQGGAATLSVQVSPGALNPGTYSGTVTVNATGATNSPQTATVTLLVSSNPILQLGTGSVSFNYQFGSTTLPTQQQIPVTSSGNPLGFSVSVVPTSCGNWLNVTPSNGTTPTTLNASLNTAVLSGLAPGACTASILLNSPTAGNSPVSIPASLVIGNNTLLNVSQTALNFNYQITKATPAVQSFSVSSTGAPLNFTVTTTATNCGMSFLSATPSSGTTFGSVAVAVNTAGLVAGSTCNGSVSISAPGAGNNPVIIPVTVQVSNNPLLNVSPGAINVSTQVNTTPPGQTVSLTSTDSTVALPFNVTTSTNNTGNWLLVGPTSASTPTNLSVAFQTAGLGVGTYTGSITITPTTAGLLPTVIPVSLTVTTSTTASVTPTSLIFSQPFNGPAPVAQTLAIATTATGLSYSATGVTLNGGNSWLSVSASNATTPGTVTVTANGANLGQGSYSGVVTLVIPGAANTPLNVPITLNVGPPQSLAASSTNVSFSYQAGGTVPASQTVQLTSVGGSLAFTAQATSTNNLVQVTPANGNTPGAVTISLNPTVLAGLAPSATPYTGTVTVSTTTGGSVAITVGVTVTSAPAPVVTTVVNAANNAPGSIAPGEIVTIYGTNIGPSTAAGLTLLSNGRVATTLANTTVTFDGIQAPLIYVSSGQINAIVPYEIAGRVTTNCVVTLNGSPSAAISLRVVDTTPALFSVTQGGNGGAAALNSDNTVNTAANPASKGTVVQLFATGEGALVPQATTGSVTSSIGPTFPKPVAPVSVTIGGLPAQILYAGAAPGLVSGVLQVNAMVPTGITGTGPQTVVLTVGANSNSQQTVTVAVK